MNRLITTNHALCVPPAPAPARKPENSKESRVPQSLRLNALSILYRAAQCLLVAALFLTPHLAQAHRRNISSNDPATVQNVQIADFYGHSVVLRWDAPKQPGSIAVSGYYVTWQAAGQTTFESKIAAAQNGKPNAFQIQPLDPTKTYAVTLTPLNALGQLGKPFTLNNISAKGTYETLLKQYTNNGLSGFLYLPELDPVNGRVNPLKINNDCYNVYSGDANGNYFDHSGVAVNNQQHWHMIADDYGTGAITSRIKAAIPVDSRPRTLMWDCDSGPFARQTWYIVLTPNKVEQFLLFPNNGDDATTNVYPREQIQIKFTNESARVTRIAGGNMVAQSNFNWRQTIYANVRQLMSLVINSQGLTCFADTGYNGQLAQTGAFATDLSGWKSCYAYFTLGSYNNRKYDAAQGTSATGKPMLEFQGGNMHWGNVAIVTPDGTAPPVELSYFQQPDAKTRAQEPILDVSQPLTVNIPDKIPTDATARELIFTDKSGCIPCLSGTNKLILSVNGKVLPNKHEDEAWADYPTYRWAIPANILKQGANAIVFGQSGTPDPMGIANLHIDIHVPVTSPAAAAYTPPPAHTVLDTMPDHTELEGWTIPRVAMTVPAKSLAGAVSLPVQAYSYDTQHLAGSVVAFDSVWAEINGTSFWSQDTNAAGLGTVGYAGSIPLNTTKYADGYYEIKVKAHAKSGSLGFNNGSDNFNYDTTKRVLIVNTPSNKTAPKISALQITAVNQKATSTVRPNDTYYVRRTYPYSWKFSVQSRNPLVAVQMLLKDSKGVDQPYRALNPAFPTAYTPPGSPGGTASYLYTDAETLWDWWPFDSNGLDRFTLQVTDVFGNSATFPFLWSLVDTTPAPPAPQIGPARCECVHLHAANRSQRVGVSVEVGCKRRGHADD